MYSYGLLETGCYYLIQEKENSPIALIRPTVESDHCLFVTRYDEPMVTEWKRKNDSIHDIIECLTDESVKSWEKNYNAEDEESLYGDEDED
jgi:hypothetical protein